MKRYVLLCVLVAAGIIGFSGMASADLNEGLVAYYPFNGNADDESGNGNDGIVNEATLTLDRFGRTNNAYDFDGSSTYIHTTLNNVSIGNNVSITAWFKTKNLPSHQQWIIDIKQTSPSTSAGDENEKRLFISGSGGNTIVSRLTGTVISYQSSRNGGYKDYLGETTLTEKEWCLGTVTWDGKNLKLFINDKEDTPYLMTQDDFISTDNQIMNLFIGASAGLNNQDFFNGSIDDIRIYNRVLSKSEIQELYNETENTNPNNEYDEGFEAGKQYCRDNPEECGIDISNDTCIHVVTYGQVPNGNCWIMFPTPCDVPDGWQTTNEEPTSMCGAISENDGYDEGYSSAIADVKADPSAYGLYNSCDTCCDGGDDTDNCATLESNFNIAMPCIDVFGTRLPIGLVRFTYSDDPFGYYWKLNLE